MTLSPKATVVRSVGGKDLHVLGGVVVGDPVSVSARLASDGQPGGLQALAASPVLTILVRPDRDCPGSSRPLPRERRGGSAPAS